jgi:hypothetical protein
MIFRRAKKNTVLVGDRKKKRVNDIAGTSACTADTLSCKILIRVK